MKTRTRQHRGHGGPEFRRCAGGPIGLPDEGAGLADLLVRNSAVHRVRRHLAEAEVLFVARVVQDGGIGPWRLQTREKFQVARHALEHSRIARSRTADLVVALVDQHVRDWCWLEVEVAPDQTWSSLWLHLVRHALPPFRAEPLFLLAWTAWRRHDDALARLAVAAARAEDPGHEPARLLAELLGGAVDPARLPSLADWTAARDVVRGDQR